MLLLYLIAALFGLAFGSFLNVCIFRLTSGESIVTPRSHCRQCGQLIRWYDNIPVVSYVLLGGRCRGCRRRISPIYPLVELLTGAVFVAALFAFGLTLALLKCTTLSMLLLVVTFTDLLERTIPRPITVLGLGLGLVFSLLVPVKDGVITWIAFRLGLSAEGFLVSLAGAVAGAVFGGGLFYLVGEIFSWLRHKQALGFGDVMLMAMVGAFFGVSLTYLTILLGSLFGSIVAGLLYASSARFRRGYLWPYGSFLAVAAIYVALAGRGLLEAYARWTGLGS